MAGKVARMGQNINTYIVFMGKPERKGPLRRHSDKTENNIKMNLTEIVCDDMD
jgi:hypothetical protein